MSGFEISREERKLVARGAGDKVSFEEAVRAFVLNEIAEMPPPLSTDAVEEAQAAGKRIVWHPNYDRSTWPDTDPPLEIVEVWRSDMLRGDRVVFYKCQQPNCCRCRNPLAEWSSHLKTIRADGLDAVGVGVEVEVRRGKKRETVVALVDQPVFVLEKKSL